MERTIPRPAPRSFSAVHCRRSAKTSGQRELTTIFQRKIPQWRHIPTTIAAVSPRLPSIRSPPIWLTCASRLSVLKKRTSSRQTWSTQHESDSPAPDTFLRESQLREARQPPFQDSLADSQSARLLLAAARRRIRRRSWDWQEAIMEAICISHETCSPTRIKFRSPKDAIN